MIPFSELPDDWCPLIGAETKAPYFAALRHYIADQRENHEVYPPPDQVFKALDVTPADAVRVVILGQDPYHDTGQAHGLSFSVRAPTRPPPSLRNMFKELETDLGIVPPGHGDLTAWARRGVLLLNTVLTVRAHEANSHRRQGWEHFTDAVMRALSAGARPLVFVLWGGPAKKKRALIDVARHRIIESAHPSPLSAYRGFLGSRPYSAVNAALRELGHAPIDWSLD